MTVDKRSVSTDALDTLGNKNIPDNSGRDAIHLAVEPVVCGDELLRAGDHVGLVDGIAGYSPKFGKKVGIVDPFIKGTLSEGDRFWLVVYPREITSLRHVWTHPAFDDDIPQDHAEVYPDPVMKRRAEAEAWIIEYAEKNDIPIQELLDGAGNWVATYDKDSNYRWSSGEYLNMGGRLEGLSTPPEFWDHYEALTGNAVPEEMKENFFSCSC
jgi:hypothetical protein